LAEDSKTPEREPSMSAAAVHKRPSQSDTPWWREKEVALLFLLIVPTYFCRLGSLSIRGEEPTRAQAAREMVESGNWLVPQQQGRPFWIRPPLQHWAIAVSCLVAGCWDEWAVRLPSGIAVLCTALLVYGYARTQLSRLGALGAALALVTMGELFQMGRQAETEALLICLVSGSLLGWHWAWSRRVGEAWSWSIGYAFMALAMLTKGLPGPAYFFGGVGLYLILTGQVRKLFTVAHLIGACAGAALLLAWVLPYASVLGGKGVYLVFFGDPAVVNITATDYHWTSYLRRLVEYPVVVFVGILPWSLFLIPFTLRRFRRTITLAERDRTIFLGCCASVIFAGGWLLPGGAQRFVAPMYPALAVLIGLVIERSAAATVEPLRTGWKLFLRGFACLVAGVGVVVAVAAIIVQRDWSIAPWVETNPAAVIYAVACLGAAWLLIRNSQPSAEQARTAILTVATMTAVTMTGIVHNVRMRRSCEPAAAMRALKEKLPANHHLVSFGPLSQLFPYYYGLPIIEPRPMPTSDNDPTLKYFCFNCSATSRPDLPFAWREIGAIPLDRNQKKIPERVVVVGLRLNGDAGVASENAKSKVGRSGPHTETVTR
jgi:4-amino-4-deoxy-L-arabinose transferase-like glycosyltransferase